ncbi:MAG: hypothetical protein PHQ05_01090 [Sterolibacterium sp.]|nr:hypothetical protein [Sterolibacterium sp.]
MTLVFLWDMIGALTLIPALSHFLLKEVESPRIRKHKAVESVAKSPKTFVVQEIGCGERSTGTEHSHVAQTDQEKMTP